MRYNTDVLEIVVVTLLTLTIQDRLKVVLCIIVNHVELRVLRVLIEVSLDLIIIINFTKGENLEEVLHAVFGEELRLLLLHLLEQPHITVSSKQHLRWHLVHLVDTLHAASHVILQLLLHVLELDVASHVPVLWVNWVQDAISILAINLKELKLSHVFAHDRAEASCELEVKD